MIRVNLIPSPEALELLYRDAYLKKKRAEGATERARRSEREVARPELREQRRNYQRHYYIHGESPLVDQTKRPLKTDAQYQAERRARLRVFKMKPCMDCGRKFPLCCMDFDHRDPTQKLDKVRYRSLLNLPPHERDPEIEKCDLVCACCHRIRTAKRQGSLSAEPWWSDNESS